ncbi:MAG: CoA transferase [Acidimicrobiia bacterium]|nr:CoA transferase [Acidimicrobiia bacterium]
MARTVSDENAGPLADVRVLECGQGVAVGQLGKLFVDAGADVIKVEPVGGDRLRRVAATVEVPEGEDGALFRFLGAGKRSIIGRLDDERVTSLLPGVDVVIEDGDPDLDIDALRAAHPRVVVVSISPYGRSGPWAGRPATDLTLQAESGGLQFRGPTDRPPIQAGGLITEFLGALFAAAPTLAAVLEVQAGGDGTHLDVSIHDVMALAGSNHLDLVHQLAGSPEVGPPVRTLDTPGIERAADGLVAFNTNAGHMMQMFLLMIGHPDLMDDPVYLSLNERLAMGPTWQSMIDTWTTAHTVDEIVQSAVELRVPVAPCHDGASIVTDEQLVAREAFVTGADGFVRPRPPYRLDGRRLEPADEVPRPGAHDAEVGPSTWSARSTSASGSMDDLSAVRSMPNGRPLEGLLVVDLTSWWVGTLTTQFLGRLGADVVHVEGPGRPDGMRLTGKMFARTEAWWEYGHMFAAVDTDRRAIAVDLASEDGREVLWRLIERADFLVENFAPRVAESWGLTHEAVLARNPGIVYLRMPAFGLDGPWRDRPAFAQTIEPMSTMSSITGYPDGKPVSKGGLPDPVGGSTGAWAAMVAHAERLRTGRGVAVESVMLEAAVNVSAQPALEFLAHGTTMGRHGNRSSHAAPQGVYPSVADGEWVAVSVVDDAQWRSLAGLIGGDALAADPRFATHGDRFAAHDELDALLAAWTVSRRADAAADELVAAGVPAGSCRDPRTLRRHPQYVGRGVFETVDHPVLGAIEVPGQPYRQPGMETWITRPAPTFGQHNTEVLREAGFTPEEIAGLEAAGVIADRPRDL